MDTDIQSVNKGDMDSMQREREREREREKERERERDRERCHLYARKM